MESEANREQPKAADLASSDSNTALSKSEAIAALQNTIQQLEEIVTQLNSDVSIEEIPFESSVDTLVTTTQELATAIATPTQTVSAPQPPQNTSEVPQEPDLPITPVKSAPTVPQEPATEAPKVASNLPPQPKKARNNKRLLIGAISALIVIGAGILWWRLPQKPVTLLSQSQSTDTEIVAPADDTETEANEIEIATEIDDQEISATGEIADSFDTSAEDLVTDAESEAETILDIDIPQQLEAPTAPQKIKIETIEPEIILTPEQNLIAAIQNRVAEITQDYSEDLIISIEADFQQNSLSIILSNLWYELSQSRQNKLANDILRRSRRLDFRKLDIKNTEGTLVARNPVIGNTAIILQRVQE